MRRKSLLYQSGVEYADFAINHVLGCSHGCRYPCYAMQMAKRFGRVKSYDEWRKPKLVENAIELLDKEIPKYKNKIRFVHLCFMTDPFMQGHKEIQDMTLKIIARLNQDGIRCTTLTKGVYPKVLVDTKKYGKDNEYGITLVSLDESFRKEFEPYSAPFSKRIDALKYLSNNGLKTWVSIEPYPTPNLVKQELLPILKRVSFVDKIVFGKLNYNVKITKFKENKEFYETTAQIVKEFCEERGIECHIKHGTQQKDDKKTETLFAEETKSILVTPTLRT